MSVTPITVNSPFEDISLDEEDLEGTGLGVGNRGAVRSELKRQREKNRRKAITNAYGELASFIVQLDPELGEEDLVQMHKKRRKSGDGDKTSGISQVNVVGLALKLMKRLHSENEENKRILKAMQEREEQDFNSENVGGRYQTSVFLTFHSLTPFFLHVGSCHGPNAEASRR